MYVCVCVCISECADVHKIDVCVHVIIVEHWSNALLLTPASDTNYNIVTYASPVAINPSRYALVLYAHTLSRENMIRERTDVLQLLEHKHEGLVDLLGRNVSFTHTCSTCIHALAEWTGGGEAQGPPQERLFAPPRYIQQWRGIHGARRMRTLNALAAGHLPGATMRG
jgi:hypothetical protein